MSHFGPGMGGIAGATAILSLELCIPILMLCWLCCWPDDGSSDTSSRGKHPKKPVIASESSGRHATELFGRRFGSSAASLHTPGTSGYKKQPLSAHRSHEEIRSRRKSHHETQEDPTRYHSAPSVIDEVIHRRDWERSSKDLRIPLRPDSILSPTSPDMTMSYKSDEEIIGRACKKHHTNIKKSKKTNTDTDSIAEPTPKESTNDDVKDEDATEMTQSVSNFYIGDTSCVLNKENIEDRKAEDKRFKAKEVKQSLNESIKYRDRPRNILGPLAEFQVSGGFEDLEIDRSGAIHHFDEPRGSCCDTPSVPYPPLAAEPPGHVDIAPLMGDEVRCSTMRGRHASAGDVLAPSLRPHSAALSESDLDFELECCDELPPAYDQVQMLSTVHRKETAI